MYARLFLASLLLAVTASVQAMSGVGSRVENFRLLDHQGQSHELYYFSDMKAVVLMTHSIGCRPAENAIASLNQVSNQYGARGVQVFLLNSTAGDARDAVRKESERLSNKVPVLLDPLQLIGESLGATRAGETLVINPANWTVEYRGSVEGVPAAVDALASGKAVPRSSKKAKGCTVKLPEARRHAAHAKVSYEKTIAPILEENCVTCHRQGGIGPWAMSNYEMVRGFAPMIREVLRTQRMPPWHADPHYGVFSNDRSLDASQTKTLVHWIEAGAPRGKGDDPLTKVSQVSSTWQLGQPDLVVEIPAFDVPATGTIPYQRPVVKNPLGRDVWVRAIEFIPTDRSVVHHILAGTTGAQRPGDELSGLQRISSLGTFVPGDVPHFLPDDTAVFIPKDADFAYQVHYTANGKPVREVTRIGLYFAKEQPKYTLRNTVLADTSIKIPANAKAHTASTSRTFTRDVLIYHLLVHAHVRGNGAEYVAQYPDGTKEILLSVPKYDFNWQTTYELATPKLLPKGTTLYYSTTYDNSSQNKANPNPNIEVRWGPQTWEEMLYGDIRFRYPDEALSNEERARKPELTAAAEAESAAESGHPSN
jgi:hypothetical protein